MAASLFVRRALMLATTVFCGSIASIGHAQSSILINEIDADTTGTDTEEFVELSDGGTGNTALDGLVLVFYNGSNDQSYAAFDLDGTVTSADGYYVLGNAGVAGVGTVFPSNGLQNGQDAVALYAGDAADFPDGTPVTTDNLIDAVVYGTGDSDDPELDVLLVDGAPQLDEDANGDKNNQSLQRTSDSSGTGRDTRSFTVAAPTPNAATGSAPDNGNDTPDNADGIPDNAITGLRIYDIQGASHLSPHEGDAVAGVPGIVTAVTGNGFYFQDPDGDGDAATSDAVLVFTGGTPTRRDGAPVAVGDVVAVAGTVKEFYPGDNQTNLPTTEIAIGSDGSTRAIDDVGAVFDQTEIMAVTIGQGGRIAPQVIIDNDTNGDVATSDTTVFDPEEDGLDFYESLEAMRVRVNQGMAVGPTSRFGEIFLVPDAGATANGINARGGITLVERGDIVDCNPERIQIDDTLLAEPMPAVDTGALFTEVVGVLGYGFGNFEILPDTLAAPQPSNLNRSGVGVLARGDTLTVAGYNVENLDPNDDDGDTDIADGKFEAIADQIVDQLGAPDILALQEVQDNDGSASDNNDPVVAADRTLARLVDAIVEAGGPRYTATEVVPESKKDVGQPGGNIRVAYLYDASRVNLVEARDGVGDATTATQVSANSEGQLALTLNPGRVQPQDPAFNNSRKPVAALFEFRGQRVLLVNNHFASKGGSSPLFGALQPYENGSADQRSAQAAVVNAFVDDALAAMDDARIGLVGDFHEFGFLAPMKTLTGADTGTPVVSDLLDTLDATARYTYVYEGNSQALDHFFVSPALATNASVTVAHVNAQFADQVSDHDPIVASFDMTPSGSQNDDDNDAPAQASDDDSSGGCTLGNGHDASLVLLLCAAVLTLGWRRRRKL
ncbi:JDVT-CTERM domain-containing protein [Salinisphaera sp. T5B8]|uniref:JDVT-CTERM domain-containing protein n=1 Tax=Salinisphaera sp. T5B8 TaxID=1304154 RepID=UPI0033403516